MKTGTYASTFSHAADGDAVLLRVYFEYIDVLAESVCVVGTFNQRHPGATPQIL